MKKLISILVLIAVMLLAWGSFAPSHAQNPADEEKPTFYRLVPGTYVNGWPRFTVTYPKDFVEIRGRPIDVFRAGVPGPPAVHDFGVIMSWQSPLPLEKFVDIYLNPIRASSTEVTVVSDKPSQLRDGTPARESGFHFVVNGVPIDSLCLGTKKGDIWVVLTTSTSSGKIGQDLKAILYSLEFEPGKDEPVKVPPDVQEFLDSWRNAIVSHDLARVMTHYSDRFLDSGMKKGERERMWRGVIGPITSIKVGITDFEAGGDRAYLAGFTNAYWGKAPLREISIIKENGEWKWYGNQRDVSP